MYCTVEQPAPPWTRPAPPLLLFFYMFNVCTKTMYVVVVHAECKEGTLTYM